jgi:hypothetical protein
MKPILFFSLILCGSHAMAQPKLITQATINSTTTIVAPEEEDVSTIQNQGGGGPGGGMRMMFGGDGETKSVTQVKNDMVKTVLKTDMGRTTIIRNNAAKLTTTLMEMMGNKTGFFVTDEEQAQLRKRMDSMMQSRSKDSSAVNVRRPQEPAPVEIVYAADTKKIAGYECKKAYLVTTRILGIKDSTMVWYTPEFKINHVTNTGGGGFGMSSSTSNGFDKIDGFVMGYETKMRRNRTMTVQVTKIDFTKEVTDKDFEIPKDFEVKPMKEMGGMMGGGGQGGGNPVIIRRDQ